MINEVAKDYIERKKITPMRAIRAKCLDCSGGYSNEVASCPITDCPLYSYRDGHNPTLKGRGNADILKRVNDGSIAVCVESENEIGGFYD